MNILKIVEGVMNIVQGNRWCFVTAEFTGAFHDKAGNTYSQQVPEGVIPYSYELRYHIFERGDLSYWYIFEKGKKPDPASLAGTTIKIKYDRDDPHSVCVVDD